MSNTNPVPAVESLAVEIAKDAATIAVIVAPVVATLAAVLPGANLPAADTAIITAVAGALTAFVSWAKQRGLVAKIVGR